MKSKIMMKSFGLILLTLFIFSCSLFDNDDKGDDEIPLLGPYQADFDNYSYVTFLFCEMFNNDEDGILIMPSGISPDSLNADDVNLQINGEEVEVGQFLHIVAASYEFNEGEFYDFTLNILGDVSSATLYRPYSVEVVFPDTLIIGEQYLIEWTIENNNINQGFITDTHLSYNDSENRFYSEYDEIFYFDLDPSVREFEYSEVWMDSLDIENGSISLGVSQWYCEHDNDVYFVCEEYDEEFYLISGNKARMIKRTSMDKIIEKVTKIQ